MNEYTFDYVERNRLDVFCKTVLRNEAINYLLELSRRRDREKSLDTLPQAEMDKLCTLDEYPSDSFVFSAFGYALHFNSALRRGYGGRRDRRPCGDVPQRRPASPHKDFERIAAKIGGRRREETDMKQPTFHGRVE